jgi:hypothetical protein
MPFTWHANTASASTRRRLRTGRDALSAVMANRIQSGKRRIDSQREKMRWRRRRRLLQAVRRRRWWKSLLCLMPCDTLQQDLCQETKVTFIQCCISRGGRCGDTQLVYARFFNFKIIFKNMILSLSTYLLILFVLNSFAHNHVGDDDDHEDIQGGVSFFLDRTFELRWKFQRDKNVATFAVRTAVGGWFAVGFSNSSQMPKTDIVAFIECGRAQWDDTDEHKHIDRHFAEATPSPRAQPLCMSDRWATKYSSPPSDYNLGGDSHNYVLLTDPGSIIPDRDSLLTVEVSLLLLFAIVSSCFFVVS